MNVAIFGASGRTGLLLTERALDAGYGVSVLVRKPGSFPYAGRVRVVEGDAFDSGKIAATVRGADAVLSALGARSLKKDEVLERGVPLIVSAMEAEGVRRIVVLGSAGALDSALDKQPGYRRWIVQQIVYNTILKWPVEAQRAQYRILSASRLDWTMVMPPMLTDGKASGRIRVDGEALPRGGSHISRADVADFFFAQLVSDSWMRRGVYVSR